MSLKGLSFSGGLVVMNLTASAEGTGDVGLNSESGRSPGGVKGDHSSILAWRIPWTELPGGPWSMGLHRVRQD